MRPLKPSIFVATALAGSLFLVYAGLVMAPLVGVQTDEALFAAPLLSPKSAAAWVFDHVPIMQMTYLGSLKTWLYALVFDVFGTGVYSLRVPTILLSAGAILLWTFWLRQVGGRTIAAVFVLLQAARSFEETVEAGGQVAEAMRAFRRLLGSNDMLAYLSMMAPRLVELRRVLKPTDSLYLHCDPTASRKYGE